MKYFILFSALCSLMISNISAQSDFRNGYIVTNTNDTVYGLIDYRGDRASSKRCIFKKDINSEKQEFSPNDLKFYRFIDSKYFAVKSIESEGKKDLLFLEYLIDGAVDIYYYREQSGDHFFLDSGDDKLIELKNEQKEVNINNQDYLVDSKEYIDQLKYSFRDSPAISQKVDNIDFEKKSLIKIALDYHEVTCPDKECIIYEKKIPRLKLKFGPLIGINYLSIPENGRLQEEIFFLDNCKFENYVFPTLGFFCKTSMPSFNEHLYFQYEGTFSNLRLKWTNVLLTTSASYNSDIKLTETAFNNLGFIKYGISDGRIRPTFQIGGFANYFFNTDFIRNLEVKDLAGETLNQIEFTENPFPKFDYGLCMGVGIWRENLKKKAIFLDLRYQIGFGMLTLYSNYFSFNLGFEI